jgi:TolB protein
VKRLLVLSILLGVAVPVAQPSSLGCNATFEDQDAFPRWSPGGDFIAFTRVSPGCDPAPTAVYVIRADGSRPSRVGTGPPASSLGPASWSPDARLLAFAGPHGIYVADVNGRGLDQLTRAIDSAPAWSPDGRRIAFRRGGELWVMDRDGTLPRRVGGPLHDTAYPVWAPDSRHIAFAGHALDTLDVWVADVETGAVTNLGVAGAEDGAPTWSPDARLVAFASSRRGNHDIWIASVDGTTATLLAGGAGDERDPSWSPTGDRIAYASPTGVSWISADGRRSASITRRPDVLGPAQWGPPTTRGTEVLAFSAGGRCRRYGIYVVEIDLPAPFERRMTNECERRGSREPETIRGSAFSDFIYGFAGNDRLYGLGRRDQLFGGAGDDLLDGDGGFDTLVGGPGDDVLIGRGDPDRISGGPGHDRIDAGIENDTIHVRDGWRDLVACGGGRRDSVIADRLDSVARDCERVER